MTDTGAFGGDPNVKAALLARIDRHVADGTMTFGDSAWTGDGGSALGVSIAGIDPATYAAAFGYPLPLAALLDPLARDLSEAGDAPAFVRSWVSTVTPGADLSGVPTRLMLYMLDDPRLRGIDDALADRLVGLHCRDLDGSPGDRGEWSSVRRSILAAKQDADPRATAFVVGLWEVAAWPAARGRSTLVATFNAWRQLQAIVDDPEWSREDECRKEAKMKALWYAHAPAADGGEVDLAALFEASDPALARRSNRNLRRVRDALHGAAPLLADRCTALFRDA
ncbi:hypothetical protein [Sphingomonas sp. Leaf25]|uniref:hypothetical protein n=1 Tax=Sphingomonas sp. Leaf25 TaxID=1735692 RepID=UPI0006FA88D4|nr:hypothetical protein [Sphingomonas sp. Leaf25]KQN00086.1 hypothetical protein ASE78_17610 [Sphingomonas sp. Leaf25]